MLNYGVKWCKNCTFCSALAQFRGKTSCIPWRHSSILKSSRQRWGRSAMSWRQNNGKMAEKDRSHVIAVLQSLKCLIIGLRMKESTITMQTVWRSDAAKKCFLMVMSLIHFLDKKFKWHCLIIGLRMTKSAITIQTVWRSYAARKRFLMVMSFIVHCNYSIVIHDICIAHLHWVW